MGIIENPQDFLYGLEAVIDSAGIYLALCGFGVDVEKLVNRLATGVFRSVEPFQPAQYTSRQILMI